jgi:SnoaL-like domain
MNRFLAVLGLIALCTPAYSQDADTLRQLADRAAIQEVMQRYVWSVDALDADTYVSVFTEDGEIDSNGNLIKGHAAIRKIVTDAEARQAANRTAGKPPGALYHVISNERISFTSPTEALYQSYWQTLRKGDDKRYVAGGFGRSEDHLVKRDGKWLIKTRKLVVYTD